ncbi:MAG: hypothetical protein ACTHN8_11705 [Angustibacter sp.]
MSTTAAIDPATSASSGHRARLSSLALAAGGVGVVVGHLLTVPSDLPMKPYLDELAAHRTVGVVGGLLTAMGAFLVVPGLTAALRLARARGARLATSAAILAGVGITALGAGDVMLTLVMGGLVTDHRATAEAVHQAADTEGLLSLPFAFAPLFVLGMVLLGVALLRARTEPIWLGVLTIVGGLVVPFSTAGGLRAFVTLLPLGAALIALAVVSSRRA